MSKVGKKPIDLPAGVELRQESGALTICGPLGENHVALHPKIELKRDNSTLILSPKDTTKATRALWGTMRALVANAVQGVSEGFSRKLTLEGLGHSAEVQANELVFKLGLSHPVRLAIPAGVKAEVASQKGSYTITIKGIDRFEVGQFAGNIRRLKPAEPYKGKGFRYEGQVIKRKAVKKLGK